MDNDQSWHINHHQELLHIYRQQLAELLKQLAIHGTAFAPPALLYSIRENRSHIQRTKHILSEVGIVIASDPLDEEGPQHTLFLQAGPRSVIVEYGQMVLLADKYGAAALRFTFRSDGAAYFWRYKAYDLETIKTGAGSVHEQYERTLQPNGGFLVQDRGSQLLITIQSMQLEWSFRSADSGWIYPHDIGIALRNDANFNHVDLSLIQLYEQNVPK